MIILFEEKGKREKVGGDGRRVREIKIIREEEREGVKERGRYKYRDRTDRQNKEK